MPPLGNCGQNHLFLISLKNLVSDGEAGSVFNFQENKSFIVNWL